MEQEARGDPGEPAGPTPQDTPPGDGGHDAGAAAAARDDAEGPPLLDAASVALRRGPTGEVRLLTPELTHLRVACHRAFPLSRPEAWLVFFDGAGKHIGVLEDLAAMDADSAALCREELELRYVVPVVREVVAIREESAEDHWNPAQVWDLETDRGPLRLHLPNLADHVRAVGEGRLLLTDRDQRRCLLRARALGPRSRTLVGRYLWLDGLE